MRKLAIVGLIIVLLVASWQLFGGPRYDEQTYTDKLTQVQANDLLATQIFLVDENLPADQYKLLADGGIQKYEENVQLLAEMSGIENLPGDKQDQAAQLKTYTDLRIEMFRLLAKSAEDDTQDYFPQIEAIGEEIEALEIYQQSDQLLN